MKIAVSSYSFSQYLRDGRLDYLKLPAEAKKLGFDAIEFNDMPGKTHEERLEYAKKLREEAEKQGIEICAYTIGASLYQDTDEKSAAEVERLCRQIDVAEALGCHIMRHDATWGLGKTGSSRSFGLMLPTIAKNARAVTAYAKEHGVKTCVENHGYIAQDAYRMEMLFNAVNDDNFGLLVDVGNFCCADEDCPTSVGIVAPYAIYVHAKDMYLTDKKTKGYGSTRGGNYFCGCVIGEGDCKVRKSVRAIKRTGYDGYIAVEFEGEEDCMTAIARGRQHLKEMIETDY